MNATTTISWVPVDDGKPDVDSNVLLGLSDGHSLEGFLDHDPERGAIWRDVCAVEITDATITHWAELPRSPGHG